MSYFINFDSVFKVKGINEAFKEYLKKELNEDPLEFINNFYKIKQSSNF